MPYCPKCGEELPEDARFCPNCGTRISKKTKPVIPVIVKHKSPAVAAVLNFFLPGIGFVYIGTISLIIIGLVLFFMDFIIAVAIWGFWFTPPGVIISLLFGILMAILGAVVAREMNKRWVEKRS